MEQNDINNILELRNKGFSLTKISNILGINRSNVAYVCRSNNIEKIKKIIQERENERNLFEKAVCEAIPKCHTYSQVCKAVGKRVNRQYIDNIKEIATKYEVDTSHFKNFYNVVKKRNYGEKLTTKEFFVKDSKFDSVKVKNRLFAEGIKERKCEKCGITEWFGEPISLQLHHINGDHFDNRVENLQILCPNCHSQTDNYCKKKRLKSHTVKKREPINFNLEQILLNYKEYGSMEKVAEKLKTTSKTIKKYLIDNGLIKDGKDIRHLVIERYGKQSSWNNYRNYKTISSIAKERSVPVIQYNKDGEIINRYNSITETKKDGFLPSCVGKCLRGEIKTHKGFIWKKDNI